MAVKQTIRFEDLDGNPVEQDWYFSLSESDAADMDLAHHEDLESYLSEILKNKDSKAWLSVLKDLVFAAVGKREGNLLVKDAETLREFKFGGAYKQFFSELIVMEDAGAAFFSSILPANIQKRVAEEQAKTYTKDELLAMTDDEFDQVAGTDVTEMTKEQMLVAFQRRSNSKAAPAA